MRFSAAATLISLSTVLSTALGASYYPPILTPTSADVWVGGGTYSASWYVSDCLSKPRPSAPSQSCSPPAFPPRRNQTLPAGVSSTVAATTAQPRIGFLIESAASETGYISYWRTLILSGNLTEHP